MQELHIVPWLYLTNISHTKIVQSVTIIYILSGGVPEEAMSQLYCRNHDIDPLRRQSMYLLGNKTGCNLLYSCKWWWSRMFSDG